MSTISHYQTVKEAIDNGGVYPGGGAEFPDPPLYAIFEYENLFNRRKAWKFCYSLAHADAFINTGEYEGFTVCVFPDREAAQKDQKHREILELLFRDYHHKVTFGEITVPAQ